MILGIDCDFLHATLVYNDGNFTAHKEDDFKCVIYKENIAYGGLNVRHCFCQFKV